MDPMEEFKLNGIEADYEPENDSDTENWLPSIPKKSSSPPLFPNASSTGGLSLSDNPLRAKVDPLELFKVTKNLDATDRYKSSSTEDFPENEEDSKDQALETLQSLTEKEKIRLGEVIEKIKLEKKEKEKIKLENEKKQAELKKKKLEEKMRTASVFEPENVSNLKSSQSSQTSKAKPSADNCLIGKLDPDSVVEPVPSVKSRSKNQRPSGPNPFNNSLYSKPQPQSTGHFSMDSLVQSNNDPGKQLLQKVAYGHESSGQGPASQGHPTNTHGNYPPHHGSGAHGHAPPHHYYPPPGHHGYGYEGYDPYGYPYGAPRHDPYAHPGYGYPPPSHGYGPGHHQGMPPHGHTPGPYGHLPPHASAHHPYSHYPQGNYEMPPENSSVYQDTSSNFSGPSSDFTYAESTFTNADSTITSLESPRSNKTKNSIRDREDTCNSDPAKSQKTADKVFDFSTLSKTKPEKTKSPIEQLTQNPISNLNQNSEDSTFTTVKGLNRAGKCLICREGKIEMALVPCGHNLFCEDCAYRITQGNKKNLSANPVCPECFEPVNMAIRIKM